MRIRKMSIKIAAVLLLSLFMFSLVDVINVHAITGNINVSNSILSGSTPLTSSEIAAAWPNLPTATELYDMNKSLTIDLRYAGKLMATDSELPGPLPTQNTPTTYNMSSAIANYTSNDPIIDLGIIIQNDPHIWLEYNSSIWVEVPASYLQTPVQPYATAIQQIMNARVPNANSSSETPAVSSSTTWAAGEYSDAGQMNDWNNNNPVTGAITYGEWTQSTLGSNSEDYTCTDVLSILTADGLWLQEAMVLAPDGFYLTINIWSTSGGTMSLLYINNFEPWWASGYYPSLDTMYNLFIQKQSNEWDFGWNMGVVYQYPAGSNEFITYGDQSFACVESDDFTTSDFNGFWTCIGGNAYTGGVYYCLPAIGFYVGGNWKPLYVGDNCPAAYTWDCASALSGMLPVPGGTGTTNWNHFGITDPYGGGYYNSPEIFEVNYGGTATQGTQLWPEGAWKI